MNTYDALET
jgi:hypothetical protein